MKTMARMFGAAAVTGGLFVAGRFTTSAGKIPAVTALVRAVLAVTGLVLAGLLLAGMLAGTALGRVARRRASLPVTRALPAPSRLLPVSLPLPAQFSPPLRRAA